MHRGVLAIVLFLCACSRAIAGDIAGELSRKPWSGTFWPLRACWMSFRDFGQGLAPFEKYDNYVKWTRGQNPGTAAREADPANGHNSAGSASAEGWTGHCHGWCPAALLEPEPPAQVEVTFEHPVELVKLKTESAAAAASGLSQKGNEAYKTMAGEPASSLTLGTADLKAMLTEVYTKTRSDFWGRRYNARNPDVADEAYMDMNPQDMHKLLLEWIKDKDTGLVFDVDPGFMVWNQPIYKFESHWEEKGQDLAVNTTLYWANDSGVDPSYRGLETVTRSYTYTLHRDAQGTVVGGEWTGNSINDHPDFAWRPYQVLNGQSVAGLDLDVVHEILAKNGARVPVLGTGGSASATASARGSDLLGIDSSDGSSATPH